MRCVSGEQTPQLKNARPRGMNPCPLLRPPPGCNVRPPKLLWPRAGGGLRSFVSRPPTGTHSRPLSGWGGGAVTHGV
eukprot:3030586-Prymnesium_polylepis.1